MERSTALQEITAQLRWFPGDNLKPITPEELRSIGQRFGTRITMEEVQGEGVMVARGIVFEKTYDRKIAEASQIVVTVSAQDEEAFRQSIRALIDLYRAPVPMWGLWGSSPRGAQLATEVMEQDDNW
jgi:hypothetical protein